MMNKNLIDKDVANRNGRAVCPKPPKGALRGMMSGALRTTRPTGWIVLGPEEVEWPVGGRGAQILADRVLRNVIHFVGDFGIRSEAMIEKSILPDNPGLTRSPTFPVPYELGHIGGFGESGDKVNVIGHYNGNSRIKCVRCAIVVEGEKKLNGFVVLNKGIDIGLCCVVITVGANSDEVGGATCILRDGYGWFVGKVFSNREISGCGLHGLLSLRDGRCDWRRKWRRAQGRAPYQVDDERLLGDKQPYQVMVMNNHSSFFIARSFLWRRSNTSSWGMPLPSANSRREISMSRVSSIWSKRLSRSSASTRYEAARPFCVMRMGRRVSRTRVMYVERLLRHSEKGTMSSEGRQRLIGKSSVRGIVSFPFAFAYCIVQNFALNDKRVLCGCLGTSSPTGVMRPAKEGLAA